MEGWSLRLRDLDEADPITSRLSRGRAGVGGFENSDGTGFLCGAGWPTPKARAAQMGANTCVVAQLIASHRAQALYRQVKTAREEDRQTRVEREKVSLRFASECTAAAPDETN